MSSHRLALVLVTLATALATAMGTVVPAVAHDIWLDADGAASPRIVIAYGHPGDRSLPDKARLYALDLVGGGKPVSLLGDIAARDGGAEPVLITAPIPHKGSAVVVGRFDNGFWAQTPYGTKNTSQLNAPQAQRSMWSQKFAKLLVPGEGADYARSAGQRLEIVPLADPFRLKPGEALRLRVEFEGKPLAGAELSVGDGRTKEDKPVKVKADAQGVASVALKPKGLSIVFVSHRAPGSVPQLAADDALAASLAIPRR